MTEELKDLTNPDRFRDIPPGLVASIAAGLEDPKEVASRHGIYGEAWEKLSTWKPFLDAVAAQRAEFEQSGYTFRVKAAMKADVLADQLFVQALSHETSLGQKLETMKTFAKLGDLEPKTNVQAQVGPAFSISINFSSPKENIKKAEFIDVESEIVEEKPLKIPKKASKTAQKAKK
jgi:hypothetical protein